MKLFKGKSLQGTKDTLTARMRPAEMSAYISKLKSINIKEVFIMKTFKQNSNRQPGNPATRQPGNPATRQPGNPATRQQSSLAVLTGQANYTLFSTLRFLLVLLSMTFVASNALATTVTITDGLSIKERNDVKATNDNPANTGGIRTPSFDAQNRRQNESSVAISPVDPNIIAVGSNDYNFDDRPTPGLTSWFGLYVSTDGGKTWFNTFHPGFFGDTSPEGLASPLCTVTGCDLLDAGGDPVVRFDDEGNLFLNGYAFSRTSGVIDTEHHYLVKYEYTPGTLAGVSTPTSAGDPPSFTYDFTTLISVGGVADKNWFAIDANPASDSECAGNIYTGARVVSGLPPAPIRIFRSNDGGGTFDAGQDVTETGIVFSAIDHHFAIAPNGHIYITYWLDPVFGTASAKFVKSTDCGLTYSAPQDIPNTTIPTLPNIIGDLGGAKAGLTYRTLFFSNAAADDTDPTGNTVYFVYSALSDPGTFSNQDIFMLRTTDGGITWSAPVIVNDDNTVKHQYFPGLAVKNGVVHVAWIDHRDSPNPMVPSDESVANYYYAVTNIGDVSFPNFSTNVKVSDVGSDLNCRNSGDGSAAGRAVFQGDYTELAVSLKGNPDNNGNGLKHIVHMAWPDNRDVPDDRCLQKTDQEAFDQDGIPNDPFDGRKNTNIYVDQITVKQVGNPVDHDN